MEGLISIATFEIVPEEYVDYFTDYPDKPALNEQLEMTKYEGVYPL